MSRSRRRLSMPRLVVAMVAVALVAVAGTALATSTWDRLNAVSTRVDYWPYVDVTLTPSFHFEDPSVGGAQQFMLGFVVADNKDGCSPSWGTYYDPDGAGRALDLDRRIARLRARGGDVGVSFGGAVNDELAVACKDVASLTTAYRSVIRRYSLTSVDFDIEGPALLDREASGRRTAAVSALQKDARTKRQRLDIWLTLPVSTSGLTDAGIALVSEMLDAKIDIAGVNAMTMNYGTPDAQGSSMSTAVEGSLLALHRQLSGIYRRSGLNLTPEAVWTKIGATPMIGQNDVSGERYALADARQLRSFASSRSLGKVSIWSANRDQPCGAQLDTSRVWNSCSGTDQEPLGFTRVFLEGSKRRAPSPVTSPARQRLASRVGRDDPSTSPYPVWRSSKTYKAGDKVVWHQNVYEAKWWSQGDQPDEPVAKPWDTPWRHLGPVLELDLRPRPSLPPGTYREWDELMPYGTGEFVQYRGVPFRSKWWTRGETPNADPDSPWESPWEVVDSTEIGAGAAARAMPAAPRRVGGL